MIFAGNCCLTGFPTLSEVTNHSCPSSCSIEGVNNVHVRLFPNMNISCSGVLQGLTVAGVFDSNSNKNKYPEFQIWRPTTTGSSTQYNKISLFTEFQNSCSGSQNVQECVVNSISVSTGDILGILLPRMSQASFDIYFSSTTNPTPNYILSDSAVTMYTLQSTDIDGSNRPLVYLNIVEGVYLH